MMSSGVVKLSVPISSAGPHLPQFLYFSAASLISWRVIFRAGIAYPRLEQAGGIQPAGACDARPLARATSACRARCYDVKKYGEDFMRSFIKKLTVCAALLAAFGLAPASAAGYPDHPVKIIVPFAAGGPTDVMARLVAQKLSE